MKSIKLMLIVASFFSGIFTHASTLTAHPDFVPVVDEILPMQLTHLNATNYKCDVGYIGYGSAGGTVQIIVDDPQTGSSIKLLKHLSVFLPQNPDPGYVDGTFCRKFQDAIQKQLPLQLDIGHKIYASHILKNPDTCKVRDLEIYETRLKSFEYLIFNQEPLAFRQNDVSAVLPEMEAPLEDCFYTFSGPYDAIGNLATCTGSYGLVNLYSDELPGFGFQNVSCAFSGAPPAKNPNAPYQSAFEFSVETNSEAGKVKCSSDDLNKLYCSHNRL